MKTKLTLRYIVMVLLSTILLLVSAFFVLTYIEETTVIDSEHPVLFAYNVGDELEENYEGDITLSEEAFKRLVAQESWLQVLNEEGYVVESYNTPAYVTDHYSPFELTYMSNSPSYLPDYTYEVGKTGDLVYLMAVPNGDWFNLDLEVSGSMLRRFGQIMFVITGLILLIMGFSFSRRIAKPVKEIMDGVNELADGDYEPDYMERGLYKPVFKQLNQLANRLKTSEMDREKTRAQREKWISNISHDLKTPLSTIKGYSEILADADYEVSADEVIRYSESIYEKSLYMEEMIEELRLNEQMMEEGIELNKEPVNLTSFIREIIVDILNHPEHRDRTIEYHTADEDMVLSLDKDLMKRGIENLLYNALIHNDPDTLVSVMIRKDGNLVFVEISDNGRGMDAEELEQLFNRYYRGLNTKNYKGTGLGMSIAKEVIEAHDGDIRVESEIGVGTKMNIRLSF